MISGLACGKAVLWGIGLYLMWAVAFFMWYGRGLHGWARGKAVKCLSTEVDYPTIFSCRGGDAAVLFAWCLLVLSCSNSHLENTEKTLTRLLNYLDT